MKNFSLEKSSTYGTAGFKTANSRRLGADDLLFCRFTRPLLVTMEAIGGAGVDKETHLQVAPVMEFAKGFQPLHVPVGFIGLSTQFPRVHLVYIDLF